ncbi:UNVERIFIED_CONTAM: hypothetical protein HDU68_003503 [Siphonaria sp. JEL0065]|nr:hypothetical protein HDU68_003503 [Siphonaria sp. JEL0065]
MVSSKRKNVDLDPEEVARRNAQNRQHQKVFRERRKDKFKDLEEKVEVLQHELDDTKAQLAAVTALPPTTILPSYIPAVKGVPIPIPNPMAIVPAVVAPLSKLDNVSDNKDEAEEEEERFKMAELIEENVVLKAIVHQHNVFGFQAAEAIANAMSSHQQPPPISHKCSTSDLPVLFDRCRDLPIDDDDALYHELLNFEEDSVKIDENVKPINIPYGPESEIKDIVPVPIVVDMRRELQQVPSLHESNDVIDELCDYINNHRLLYDDPAQFLRDVTRTKTNLLNECKNEHDQTTVLDILDRSRKQNEAIVSHVMINLKPVDDALVTSVKHDAETRANVDKDVKKLDELRDIACLNTPECMAWITELEETYRASREVSAETSPEIVDRYFIKLLGLKHSILNQVVGEENAQDRKKVFEILIILKIEGR